LESRVSCSLGYTGGIRGICHYKTDLTWEEVMKINSSIKEKTGVKILGDPKDYRGMVPDMNIFDRAEIKSYKWDIFRHFKGNDHEILSEKKITSQCGSYLVDDETFRSPEFQGWVKVRNDELSQRGETLRFDGVQYLDKDDNVIKLLHRPVIDEGYSSGRHHTVTCEGCPFNENDHFDLVEMAKKPSDPRNDS
jgi:hypothetical protein